MTLKDTQFPLFQVDRNSLKEQTTDLLRNAIINGQIPPGTKITEREVAELLEISRMPARDALMQLEYQGLIVSKPDGRYVITLTDTDLKNLYQLRLVLEKLAIEDAVQNLSDETRYNLQKILEKMQTAVEQNDKVGYISSDLAMHELIWHQARNPFLSTILDRMVGPIFMMIASQTGIEENWQEKFELHREICQAISNLDTTGAVRWMEIHMHRSLELALEVCSTSKNKNQMETRVS